MPRVKTVSDEELLRIAHGLMHEVGPDAMSFARMARACGLSPSTLVQRFESRERMLQAVLLHAWDELDRRTAQLAAGTPRTPAGAVQLLAGLSASYGSIEQYANGLLVLREDVRDPALRARGTAWKEMLGAAIEACFASEADAPEGIGLLLATHWQGCLLWWSFDPATDVQAHVETSLTQAVSLFLGRRLGQA